MHSAEGGSMLIGGRKQAKGIVITGLAVHKSIIHSRHARFPCGACAARRGMTQLEKHNSDTPMLILH